MRGEDRRGGSLFSYVDLEARVPAEHPLRAIRGIVNQALAELAGEFQAQHSRTGRPGIAPEQLPPADFSLRRLHDVIQVVFDWRDSHLQQFEVGDRVYGQTEIAGEDFWPGRQYSDRNVTLHALVARGVARFVYRYDFGDDWEHVVTVERVETPEAGVTGRPMVRVLAW